MAETVTIGKMRVRSSGDYELLALRLRLSHLMATAEFQPVGIPPQATLLIRRMTLNSPLNVEGLRISQTWQADLRETMTRYYRSAVRPRNGIVPFDVEAVLFEEQAELIATLSRMVAEPITGTVWVWHSATKSSDAPHIERLFRLWQENPRLIPIVLAYLENWHVADAILTRFSEPMQVRICRDMLAEWEIPFSEADLQTLTHTLTLNMAHLYGRSPFVTEPQQKTQAQSEVLTYSLPIAFLKTILESKPMVQAVRILAFLHRTSVSQSQLQQKFHALIQVAQKWQTEQIPIQQQSHTEESPSVIKSNPPKLQILKETEAEPIEFVQEKQIASIDSVSPSVLKDEPIETESTNLTPDTTSGNESELQTSPKLWNGLQGRETQLGGVFYLLNLILNSNALSFLVEENKEKEMPSIWQILESFAQLLLAESVTTFTNDALWQMLAHWDQREVRHTLEPSEQNEIMPQICELLRRELMACLRMTEIEFEEKIVSLLAVPATVYATAVHIDVVFPLHRIDMTARIAGLDASPGWVAEVLRVILFHFE